MAKEELAHADPSRECCERAELAALIRTDGTLHIAQGEISVHTSSDNAAVARLILRLAKKLYHLDTELAMSPVSHLDKRRRHVIYIPPQPHLTDALKDLGVLDGTLRIRENVPRELVALRCCAASYLRGAFLGGGSISEPKRGHHLEIDVSSPSFAEDLVKLLKRYDIPAKINTRRKDLAVYLKDADRIGALLALIGAHHTLLEWENLHIVRLLRNEVNRIVNCETANLTKVAQAAVKQVKDIALIDEAMGLGRLPKSLREIAYARLRQPFCSMAELGETIDPPLSKVAVAHRFRRLGQLARDLDVAV